MSSLEKRAWLMLGSMLPAYLVYFTIQVAFPSLVATWRSHMLCLAIVGTTHGVLYLTGWLIFKHQEAGGHLIEDERDMAIDGRASRAAYFLLLTGMIIVGVVMPFSDSGWKVTNSALFFIVAAEALRYALILLGYRRPRLAH